MCMDYCTLKEISPSLGRQSWELLRRLESALRSCHQRASLDCAIHERCEDSAEASHYSARSVWHWWGIQAVLPYRVQMKVNDEIEHSVFQQRNSICLVESVARSIRHSTYTVKRRPLRKKFTSQFDDVISTQAMELLCLQLILVLQSASAGSKSSS